MEKNKTLRFIKDFLFWFIIFYLALWTYQNFFTEANTEDKVIEQVSIKPIDKTPVIGHLAQFTINNPLDKKITFTSPCKESGSLNILGLAYKEESNLSSQSFNNCGNKKIQSFDIAPNSSYIFSLPDFNTEFFSDIGKYQIEMSFNIDGKTEIIKSENFSYEEPGMFRKGFRFLVSQPLFNLLIFFTHHIPNHSLGLAIIALTLLVRVLLFVPNQKAMKSQRALQKLQPKIEALRKKHGKNQQAMALKTMELYKTHKINPMSSCLPMLFQMPFLIGIYFVVKDGLSPHLNFLIYPFNQGIDLSVVDSFFLGLNLDVPNLIVLPILVGVAQFIAMKLSFAKVKKDDDKKGKEIEAPAEGMAAQMAQVQKTMVWVMPFMIAFFTATFPAGVGLYWLTSTIFGIFQQKLVNWQLDKPQVLRRKS